MNTKNYHGINSKCLIGSTKRQHMLSDMMTSTHNIWWVGLSVHLMVGGADQVLKLTWWFVPLSS